MYFECPIQDIKTLAVVHFGDLVDTIISDVDGMYNIIYRKLSYMYVLLTLICEKHGYKLNHCYYFPPLTSTLGVVDDLDVYLQERLLPTGTAMINSSSQTKNS